MRELTFVGIGILCAACGGGGTNATTTTATTSTSSAAPSASVAVAPSASAAPDDVYDDPNESSAPIVMQPEVTKTTPKSAYPKSKSTDGDCWKTVSFGGTADKDFSALIDKCGTPTGMLEYVKPERGKLHSVKDAIDSFTVAMSKGSCYRLFAVADATIHDIDIVILRNGAILGTDDMAQPVAIIQGASPFCPTDDGTYGFDVKVKGEGKGAYVFGIWTRPGK